MDARHQIELFTYLNKKSVDHRNYSSELPSFYYKTGYCQIKARQSRKVFFNKVPQFFHFFGQLKIFLILIGFFFLTLVSLIFYGQLHKTTTTYPLMKRTTKKSIYWKIESIQFEKLSFVICKFFLSSTQQQELHCIPPPLNICNQHHPEEKKKKNDTIGNISNSPLHCHCERRILGEIGRLMTDYKYSK